MRSEEEGLSYAAMKLPWMTHSRLALLPQGRPAEGAVTTRRTSRTGRSFAHRAAARGGTRDAPGVALSRGRDSTRCPRGERPSGGNGKGGGRAAAGAAPAARRGLRGRLAGQGRSRPFAAQPRFAGPARRRTWYAGMRLALLAGEEISTPRRWHLGGFVSLVERGIAIQDTMS